MNEGAGDPRLERNAYITDSQNVYEVIDIRTTFGHTSVTIEDIVTNHDEKGASRNTKRTTPSDIRSRYELVKAAPHADATSVTAALAA